MVIGCGGSGKSTLSSILSDRLNLELISLDLHYWKPGWRETIPAEWAEIVRDLIARPNWVMDGNYGGTMDLRIARTDMIIFLHYPSWVCLFREIGRTLKYLGRVRPGMTAGCPTRISFEFWNYIWHYNKTRAPVILEKLKSIGPHQEAIILHSNREVRNWLKSIS